MEQSVFQGKERQMQDVKRENEMLRKNIAELESK